MSEKIKLIEVKSEIGAGTRGASMGFEALKIAGHNAKSNFFQRYESVEVENVNEMLFKNTEHAYAKYIDGILVMEERVCLEVYEQILDDNFPLIISGDHSTSFGTIAGIKKAYPKNRIGVIWIDAHADLHSPYTSPSGNMHGMSLSMACELDNLECKSNSPKNDTIEYWEQIMNVGTSEAKIYPEDIIYISAREVEKSENYIINKYGINNFTVEDVRKVGPVAIVSDVLRRLDHCELLYVSFDVDSIDSRISSGTGTPVPNGLTAEEAKIINVELAKSPKLRAWEITEINPTLDTQNRMAQISLDIIDATAKTLAAQPNLFNKFVKGIV